MHTHGDLHGQTLWRLYKQFGLKRPAGLGGASSSSGEQDNTAKEKEKKKKKQNNFEQLLLAEPTATPRRVSYLDDDKKKEKEEDKPLASYFDAHMSKRRKANLSQFKWQEGAHNLKHQVTVASPKPTVPNANSNNNNKRKIQYLLAKKNEQPSETSLTTR